MPADRAKLLELPRAEQQAADRDAKIIEVARKANGPNAPSIKELFPNAVARVTQYGMGVEVVSCFVAPNRTPEATIELDPVTWKPGEPLLELRDVEVFEVQYFDGTGSEVGKRSLHPALISEEFLDGRADRERIDLHLFHLLGLVRLRSGLGRQRLFRPEYRSQRTAWEGDTWEKESDEYLVKAIKDAIKRLRMTANLAYPLRTSRTLRSTRARLPLAN